MKAQITRALFLHFSFPPHLPLTPLRHSLPLIHTVAGDDPHRRRTEPYHSSSSSSLPRRHHDEESRSVKVTVWWDFENCNIPIGVNAFRVAQRITSALRSCGIRGPVNITAFGDVVQLSRSTQEALTSTGVCLTHVPHSGKNSSDRSFMADIVYWVSQNPPPVHFFLISGDKDFANILHRLRMSNYNILLSSTDTASGVLCSAATIMWPWTGLAKGEDVTIRHFNHPPDGLYGSWYGHYKRPLDDPFSNMEQTAASQPEELMELISDVKPRPIPRAIVNGIRQVLHLYPEGISLSELRNELKRSNITMDKDFFGHKKFSHLISSMPSILKFIPHPSGEGQPLVVVSGKRAAESVDPSLKPTKESDISDGEKRQTKPLPPSTSPLPSPTAIAESPCHQKTVVNTSVGTSSLGVNASVGTSAPPQVNESETEIGLFRRIWRVLAGPQPATEEPPLPGPQPATEEPPLPSPQPAKEEPPLPGKDTNTDTAVGASAPQKGCNVEVKEGIFRRVWKTLAGPEDVHFVKKNDTISEVESTTLEDCGKEQSFHHAKKVKSEEKTSQRKSSSHPSGSGISSLDENKLPSKDKTYEQDEKFSSPEQRMGFFNQIISWWKSLKSDAEGKADSSTSVKEAVNNQETDSDEKCAKTLTHTCCHSETHDLYSKPYFWHALKSFLRTEKGSDLISKSRTREQLVHGLQTESPLVKKLKESHLLHLVDLLISEKKWVEESASQVFPFKLSLPAQGSCVPSHGQGSNGLSSLFTGKISRSNLQTPSDQERQDHNSGSPWNSYNGGLDAKPPQDFTELQAWFQKVCNGRESIEPSDLPKLFESKFNRKVVCSLYGYSSIQSLLEACLTDTVNYQEKKKRSPTREEILSDCHKLLTELFEENPEGFNMCIFRPRFIQKYGYVLNYEMLGYPKLVSLLQIMPGVRIESSFILPVAKFPIDFSQEKPLAKSFTHVLESKGKFISSDKEGTGNSEESIWEELGPVSDTATHENHHINQEKDTELSFKEVSLSEEEFSDSEDDTTSRFDGAYGERKRGEEDSSLLQILDSWYSVKESGERDRLQAVDGLVDCSRSNAHKTKDLPKVKARSQKRCSFISDSGDDQKEKLVESILGSLKRAGDSRLQS